MNSKKYSKKIQDVFLDDPYKILSFMRWGVTTPANLLYELGIESKQHLNHYLKKYVQEGLLQKLGKGMYVMTESGKRIYDKYEHYKNKQLVRVENLKVTFVVEKAGEELVKNLKSQKQELRNNVIMYHAKLKRHSTRLIVSNDQYKFEVTVTNALGITPNEAFHYAMLEAYDVANYLTDSFDVELSEGYANGKPEIAIPSPFASALLNTTGASQIRTDKAIMNRSKGRGADWEVYNLQDAQKIVDMPDTMARLEEKIDRIEKNSVYPSPFYSNLAGNSHWGFF
jgi:predicted transcriptional regulator